MVVPRGTPYNRTRLDPDSLNKPAKDSSNKAQAYNPYQKEYKRFPPTTRFDFPTSSYAGSISRRSDLAPAQRAVRPSTSRFDRVLVACPITISGGMLTYSEYFCATPSPFGSSAERNKAYATIFSYFTLASLPQVLLEHLLNLFEAEAVGALGIFVADPQGLPCLRLVHGLRKYPGPLAQHSPNKNKAFGYLDDIEGEAGELVLMDSAMLPPTIASQVLTLDHHLAEVEAHPGRLSIPVIPEETGHSELIRAHKAFFIPF
eukprot:jgi/Psemu1/32737/gm1.32737_g